QPHLRRAPLVRVLAIEPGRPEARLVLVAAAARRSRTRDPRGRAHQLAIVLLRLDVAARRADGRVLPAPLLAEATRPQLGEPGGPPGHLRHDALVARPGCRRLPYGR